MEIIAYLPVAIIAAILWYLWRRACRACEAANEADWGGKWLNRLDGLNRLFCRRYHRLRAAPIPLPAQGAALVAANHVSGLDPMLMIAAARRPLRFMIAREEYERFGLTWLFRAIGCIPVEREHHPEQALRHALRVLQQGEVVAIFPHGRIHLDGDPPRRLKAGVAKLARMTGCAIYPVRIDGVRGQGHTLLAVALRSRARLHSFEPLDCTNREVDDCLARLAPLLETAREA
ncbi:MAG: lysophospholipid acyltransferase family protein [Pseudomonadota bacterium]